MSKETYAEMVARHQEEIEQLQAECSHKEVWFGMGNLGGMLKFCLHCGKGLETKNLETSSAIFSPKELGIVIN